MLKESVYSLFNMLRMATYQTLFGEPHDKAASLNASESFNADVLFLEGNPTVTKFASSISISQPNATYKINTLAEKGFVLKSVPEDDRREVRIHPTEKLTSFFGLASKACENDLNEVEAQFTQKELETACRVMDALSAILKEKHAL